MPRARPNILFILADDLGWNDLGASGSRYYESPHIDSIAAAGMRFTQAYAACQVCSPSRASILTGKVTPRHGVTDWLGAATGADWRRHGRHNKLLPPPYRQELGAEHSTFPAVLRRHGYRTLFVGKWHLGDVGAHPEDRGFDVNVGGWKAGSPIGGYFSPYQNPMLPNRKDGECLPLRLADEMSRLIEQTADRPFLAYLSFYSVHGPIETSKDRWERFRRKAVAAAPGSGHGVADGKRPAAADQRRFAFDRYLPVRLLQDCPVYAGMIAAMDEAVGVVLATLRRLGLAQDTIVVFTSYNGGVVSGDSYSTSCLPLRGGKGRQWEGGIREPLFFRVPGLTAPGSCCHVPVCGIDFYPTLLELAGVAPPDEAAIDGLSLVSLLRGEADGRVCGRDLFWHYPHYGNQGGEPASIIRRGDWKLIHYYEDGRDELYDLATDPGERRDQAPARPPTAAQLRERLDRWLEEVGARFPVPDPEYDAAAERRRLAQLEHDLMPRLEAQHRAYLEPDWQPNPDWWGSQATGD
jgi:arylsulfatase A-like enzyme